jgi:hypothetical protein
MLYKWDQLIRENKEDIATILVYETGKPRAEAYGEIDYSTDPSLRLRCRTAASLPSSSPWVLRLRWYHGTSLLLWFCERPELLSLQGAPW